jgi:hypothetical protein
MSRARPIGTRMRREPPVEQGGADRLLVIANDGAPVPAARSGADPRFIRRMKRLRLTPNLIGEQFVLLACRSVS